MNQNRWWRHYKQDSERGTKMPWYLGFAWYVPVTDTHVYLVIPLNFMAFVVRGLWWRTRKGMLDSQNRSYHEGYAAGYKAANSDLELRV